MKLATKLCYFCNALLLAFAYYGGLVPSVVPGVMAAGGGGFGGGVHGGGGGKNFAHSSSGGGVGVGQTTWGSANGGAGGAGQHGMVYDKHNNRPREQPFSETSSAVTTQATSSCIHETSILLKDVQVQHEVAQLAAKAATMDVTSGALWCEGTEATGGNAACTLDFSLDKEYILTLQDVCSTANGTYLEEDHTVICAAEPPERTEYDTAAGTTSTSAATSSSVIRFYLKSLPDCLGHSCADGSGADTTVLTTKSSHRLEAALQTRLMTPTSSSSSSAATAGGIGSLPFPYLHGTRWTCHLDLEGTETHLGSQMHESFVLDAQLKQQEELKQTELEHMEHLQDKPESSSSSSLRQSSSSSSVFAATTGVLLLAALAASHIILSSL